MFLLDDSGIYEMAAPSSELDAAETARLKRNTYMRGYKKENKEATNVQNRRWKRSNRAYCRKALQEWRYSSYERTLWKYAKRSAKARGLEFSIDVSDIVIPATCPVLGIPIEKPAPSQGKRPAGKASLDRKDNSLGYVKGNIFVVSWRANRLKCDGTIDEFKKIIGYMSAGW